ncbi:MAG: T9SS type A sorting domain-containing protein [Bacteroidales bacterium]|jgi:PKD repeat protein
MINIKLPYVNVKIRLLLIVLMLANIFALRAGTEPNKVLVSGQVLHVAYGGPIANHPVTICSRNGYDFRGYYYKEVLTNDEGYFFDTIVTNDKSGTYVISTRDKYNVSFEKDLHFRFVENIYSNIMLCNFTIDAPYQFKPLQARFKYVQKTTGDRFRFYFFDQTTNPGVIYWKWNFGDGTTSSKRNPEHVYNQTGLFQVSLTVKLIINSQLLSNTITQLVYISQLEYHHFGGHVFSEEMPIDFGFAYLYLKDSVNHFYPIDTVRIDTLGYYYFYQIPAGDYVVKSELSKYSVYAGTLLPTYYGDQLFWQEASPIHLDNTSWEYDIRLKPMDEYMPGKGYIEGHIEYDNLPKGTVDTRPAVGANVFLMDENSRMLMCSNANDTGVFLFGNIETTTYWVYPEITGVLADMIKVELSGETPNVTNIHITVVEDVASGIHDELVSGFGQEFIFPNPASDAITLQFNTKINQTLDIRLYSTQGKLVKSYFPMAYSANSVNLDVSDVETGMYLLQYHDGKTSKNHRIVVTR